MEEHRNSDGSREYVEACLRAGARVKMPVLQQLAHLSPAMPALICNHYGLTAVDAGSITTGALANAHCSELDLSHNSNDVCVCVCVCLCVCVNVCVCF